MRVREIEEWEEHEIHRADDFVKRLQELLKDYPKGLLELRMKDTTLPYAQIETEAPVLVFYVRES